MAKLDGAGRELYPGEIEGFRKLSVERLAEWAKTATAENNFAVRNERVIERKVASGFKITYKNIGGFRG